MKKLKSYDSHPAATGQKMKTLKHYSQALREKEVTRGTFLEARPDIVYETQTEAGSYTLEIFDDLFFFQLGGPNLYDDVIVETIQNLFTNAAYFKSLSRNSAIFNWIISCFIEESKRAKPVENKPVL